VLLVHNFYRSGAPSGENRVVEQDLDQLRAAGHEVELHAVSSDEIDGYSPVTKALLPARVVWSPRARRDLDAVLARWRPDVVHLHNTFPLLSASVLAATRRAGVATVATLHNYRLLCAGGSFFRDGRVCHECLPGRTLPGIRHGCYRDSVVATLPLSVANLVHARRWRRDVDVVLTLSSAQRRLFVDGGFPADRTYVKPNWVPDRPVRTAGDVADPPELAYLGRLAPEKGIDVLMRAWDLLLATSPDLAPTLTIAGGGPLEAQVVAWAATRPSVRFLGHQDAASCARITARALASVVPSVWEETFGLVVIESMAAGVPAIAPRHASFPDFIRPDVDGVLVEPDSAAALAEAMASLVAHPDRSLALGAVARSVYEARYRPEAVTARLVELYEVARARRAATAAAGPTHTADGGRSAPGSADPTRADGEPSLPGAAER
jgi:glycosyltransferase involved in cell wall biosynthesis